MISLHSRGFLQCLHIFLSYIVDRSFHCLILNLLLSPLLVILTDLTEFLASLYSGLGVSMSPAR